MECLSNNCYKGLIYFSRLFSFGVCFLHSRECGMYEASDILLGDHLLGKSDTVQWVPVDQPHK